MAKKEVKHYDFSRKPLKPKKFWMGLARAFVLPRYVRGRKISVTHVGTEGLKPPYFVLPTHAGNLDIAVLYKAISPLNANSVVPLDAARDIGDFFLRRCGCICRRKFTKNYTLVRNMKHCVDRYKSVVFMYPEASRSLDGTTSYLSNAVGKTCKLLSVPVVVLRMHGNFISAPQWNREDKKVPILAEMECILTAEEVRSLSVDEINARVREKLAVDDFAYQLEKGIEIKNPRRANGLHHILYRCPHCGKEFNMYSMGTRLWCASCGKGWQMTELGSLAAEEGETEFSHIPDWVKWEREQVREEVRSGRYRFESEVTVQTLPNAKRFYKQGKGTLVQTAEGTRLECTAYGEKRTLFWSAEELESVHIEYDYPYNKLKYRKNSFGDCVDLSTPDESYWLHPVNLRDQLTKLAFATEELCLLAREKAGQNQASVKFKTAGRE